MGITGAVVAAWAAHVAVLACIIAHCQAGRAFPITSENFVRDLFKKENPSIKWDYTNYLVDLSGFYSKCSQIGHKGSVKVDGWHPETQEAIGGMVDYIRGDMKHVRAVNGYLLQALPEWLDTSPFMQQIRHATYFGCSVRPGCAGFVSIACLFTPKYGGAPRPTTTTTTTPRPTPRTTRAPVPTRQPGEQASLAFTKEQYVLAERVTGTKWDRSHFLENLSGYEARCKMVTSPDWSFAYAKQEADLHGMVIKGIYGSTPNLGSTQGAMDTIMSEWPHIPTLQAGCSVIPDCLEREANIPQLYVVVTCVYRA